MCIHDGFFLARSFSSFLLVTTRHKDRIVYGCTKLNGSDYDTCNEWKFDSLEKRDCHVDVDGKFNNRNQNDRNGNGFEYQHNDDKNSCYGGNVYIYQVDVRYVLQIFHQRSFTDHHTV